MSTEIVVSLIAVAGVITVGFMQAYSTVISKRIEKYQKDGNRLINGMKDELVEKAGELGFERGKAKGRADLLEEISSEQPFVYFLDDNPSDIDLIVKSIKLFGPIKYVPYTDENHFINNLTRLKAVYVIDHALTNRNGLNVLAEIMEKNHNNIGILCTGTLENKERIEQYHQAGIYRIIYKDSENYMLTLSDAVKDALQEMSKQDKS